MKPQFTSWIPLLMLGVLVGAAALPRFFRKAPPPPAIQEPAVLPVDAVAGFPASVNLADTGSESFRPETAADGQDFAGPEEETPVLPAGSEALPASPVTEIDASAAPPLAEAAPQPERNPLDYLLPAAAEFSKERVDSLTLPDRRSILFDSDSSLIPASFLSVLNEVAEALKRDPALGVHLFGHSGSLGSNDYKALLSRARAATVKEGLLRMGVPEASIELGVWGEKEVAPEPGRNSRRVDLVFVRVK